MPDPNDRVLQGDDDVAIAPIDIQFDQAEYTTPAPEGPSCGVCQRPINGEYYETSGKVLCSSCRDRVTAAFRGGSRTARVLKALLFGSVASGIGAALYYAILRATGYNIGLGCDRRGRYGWQGRAQRHGKPWRAILSIPRCLFDLFGDRVDVRSAGGTRVPQASSTLKSPPRRRSPKQIRSRRSRTPSLELPMLPRNLRRPLKLMARQTLPVRPKLP